MRALVATRVCSCLSDFPCGFYAYFTKEVLTNPFHKYYLDAPVRDSPQPIYDAAQWPCSGSSATWSSAAAYPTFDLGNPSGLRNRRLHEKEPEKLQS